jgi:DNA-binding response OmpR family regulator
MQARLAIVDDEKDLVDVYLRLFRAKHLDVSFVAGNGTEAVELYRQCTARPDIVIMDNRMPLMNGVEAMRRIQDIGSPVRFIFLSADATVQQEVTEMGAVFLKKPASIRVLMQVIETMTARQGGQPLCGGSPGGGFSPGGTLL